MADLPETNEWTPGIYQLETSDPVLGGPEGVDNTQGKQLANRTRWLKDQIALLGEGKQPLDATLTALAGLILAGDKLIYATGVDTFATTALSSFIRTLLDDVDAAAARTTLGAAPLASPALTGTPTAPTAVPGTNTQQVATTAFIQAALAALVASSPAALDTLNELAAAMGNDPNFATTITNALALKAPLASPALTGSPTAPTPALFDNSLKVSTTEFVRRAVGNYSAGALISAAINLVAADCGKSYRCIEAGYTIGLPLVSGLPDGSAVFLKNTGTGDITVARQAADTITVAGSSITSFVIGKGDSAQLILVNGTWSVMGGEAALKYSSVFGASLAASGYQKLPSGLIIQWGTISATCSTTVTGTQVTLPIAFPNGSLAAVGSRTIDLNTSNSTFICEFFSSSTTQAQVTHVRSAGSIAANWRYVAIGY